MMKSNQIRQTFLDFFSKKEHKIVPSAPLINSSDPSLMFTNAGMNQFKDFFIGNKKSKYSRVADTQKCLRVSGKHNDLEEVGLDSYHHTMFEMLGNWSFGDYFKEDAIKMAWELLHDVYGIHEDKIYITVFGGDKNDGLDADTEAEDIWKGIISEDHIVRAGKKDNFWEMGEQGPCGPCSEIHIDLRSEEEIAKLPGVDLVNQDHPLVIEIWNLVFIQFNRKANGSLETLPEQHIDTGLGLERLVMVLQGKKSNYETDIFQPMIQLIEKITGQTYNNVYDEKAKKDIAFRVVTDHIRAVALGIADGEMPSNTGAGYVLRRILRRAVRYYYSFLDYKQPLIHQLLPILCKQFEDVFPELNKQSEFITKVILEEEKSFLRTLAEGLKRLDSLIENKGAISGKDAFELYDTFGFPIDLTSLIAKENNIDVDLNGFELELNKQKSRSKEDSKKETSDWTTVAEQKEEIEFTGFDNYNNDSATLLRYRQLKDKKGTKYQLVFDKTPFYAESGGQIGDTGYLVGNEDKVRIIDTQKENDLIIHLVTELPTVLDKPFSLVIDQERRENIIKNHSATHLLQAALREVLGKHVAQRGSLVKENLLRFDFSHFEKVSSEDIRKIEQIVNQKIRQNINLEEDRSISIETAEKKGATMLFGEKYGEFVRMITFDANYSRELCGGCHVKATGDIGLFKIVSETGIASGVRRIEALTGAGAEQFVSDKVEELRSIELLLKTNKNIKGHIEALLDENKDLKKSIDQYKAKDAQGSILKVLENKIEKEGVNFLIEKINLSDGKQFKNILFDLEKRLNPAAIVLLAKIGDKVQMGIIFSKEIQAQNDWNAGQLIRTWTPMINGGGGGQAFFAVAGGSKPEGIDAVIKEARAYFKIN